MKQRYLFCLLLALSGCTSTPSAVKLNPGIWNDQHFGYQAENPQLHIPSKADIFRVSDDIKQQIKKSGVLAQGIQGRSNHLLDLIYHSKTAPFLYEGYHSTTAMETWQRQRGDCISLTILAYALGRELDLPIEIQEVKVPVQLDRKNNVEYLNGHVNAIIHEEALRASNVSSKQGLLIIDFLPEVTSFQRGKFMSEASIVAAFYSNLAVEALAKKRYHESYALFKAAIATDPHYTSTYNNLAQLYQQNNLSAYAEQSLRQGLEFNPKDIVLVRALHQQLSREERLEEAQPYAAILEKHKQTDPYYWLGLGLHHVANKNYGTAIDHLQKAQDLTKGFSEIHQNLAFAYIKTGQFKLAAKQLDLLQELDKEHPKLDYLRAKFPKPPLAMISSE